MAALSHRIEMYYMYCTSLYTHFALILPYSIVYLWKRLGRHMRNYWLLSLYQEQARRSWMKVEIRVRCDIYVYESICLHRTLKMSWIYGSPKGECTKHEYVLIDEHKLTWSTVLMRLKSQRWQRSLSQTWRRASYREKDKERKRDVKGCCNKSYTAMMATRWELYVQAMQGCKTTNISHEMTQLFTSASICMKMH